MNDIGSPMSISRHLILANEEPTAPQSVNNPNLEKLENDLNIFYNGEEDNKQSNESTCVLLHCALKLDNSAALVLLGDDWYGLIFPNADSKRKSNLMLTILPPGKYSFSHKNQ